MSVFYVVWEGVWLTLQCWRHHSEVRISLPSPRLSAALCDISLFHWWLRRLVGSQSGYRRVWVIKRMPGQGCMHVNTGVVNCILRDMFLIPGRQQNAGKVNRPARTASHLCDMYSLHKPTPAPPASTDTTRLDRGLKSCHCRVCWSSLPPL